jgi:peptidoglycan/LPS O-acetylase OafA/YrhL
MLGLFGLNLWYIRSILVIYLISPLIYALLIKYKPERVMVMMTLMATIGVLVAVPLQPKFPYELNTTVCWTLARLSSFVVGMYIAQGNWSIRQVFNIKYLCFSFIALPSLMIIHYIKLLEHSFSTYLHLLPYVALAFCMPFICGVICKIIKYIPGFLKKSVEFFGVYSLEIYLVHEAVFKIVRTLPMRASMRFVVAYVGSVLLALLLHFVVKMLVNLVKKTAILRESR